MRAVAPGVWLIDGLVPYLINAYLVESPEGDILFDAGIRQTTSRFLRQLNGRTLGLVALTHCHPDHQGAAAAVCRRFAVPLACHQADVPAMEGHGPMLPRKFLVQLFHRIWSGPAFPVERVLREGDRIGEFVVVHAPGHTPGHVIYFRERDRLAIAGDVLRNSVFSFEPGGLRQPPSCFSTDPAENRRSVRRLLELRPARMLFGHGRPCEALPALERLVERWRESREFSCYPIDIAAHFTS
jgi:glyoxylase-like metal-dependent hydrolase (beta-lactamase superfamily II)